MNRTLWRDAEVEIPGVIGPYPAQINNYSHPNGFARPRFDVDTVRRIGADCDRYTREHGPAGLPQLVVLDEDRVEERIDDPARGFHVQLHHADDDGKYHVGEGCCWAEAEHDGRNT